MRKLTFEQFASEINDLSNRIDEVICGCLPEIDKLMRLRALDFEAKDLADEMRAESNNRINTIIEELMHGG